MGTSHQEPSRLRHVSGLDTPLVEPGHFKVLFALIAAFGLYLAMSLETNCDVALLLYESGRLLDGARLYVDILEINPPLIIYLNLPVAATARAMSVSPHSILPIFMFLVILSSLAICNRLRTCLPACQGQAIILLLASVLLVWAGGMYGQREHLMLTLILPYAFAAAIIADGGTVNRVLACGTGIMAAVGFALKPYFLLAFLAVECYLAARRGPRVWGRAQALAVWACFFLYAATVLVFTPEYLPFAWSVRGAYNSYHPHGEDLMRKFSWVSVFLALSVVAASLLIRRRAKGFSDVISLLGLLLTAAVYVQGKGFLYHWYPALALAVTLAGVAATALALRFSRPMRWANPEVALALLVPIFVTFAVTFWSLACSGNRDVELECAVRDRGRGESIYALSSSSHAVCIAAKNGLEFSTDNYTLLPIQGYCHASAWRPGEYQSWERMPQDERQFVSRIVTDLERARPALLLVDKLSPAPGLAGFDFLDYFQREPRFSRVMSNYRYVREFKRYRLFELVAVDGG